jgi:hypothetical protein
MSDRRKDTVRLPGGQLIPRRIALSGETELRPEGTPPVDVSGYEVLDDDGRPTELVIKLKTRPGEPGLDGAELGAVNLAALHHNQVTFEVWKRTTMVTVGNMSYADLGPERQYLARANVKAASRGLRAPKNAIKPSTLTEALDAYESKGIGAVMKMGYSRTHAYRLVKRARQELGR